MEYREAPAWAVIVSLAAIVIMSCGGETTGVAPHHVYDGQDAAAPGGTGGGTGASGTGGRTDAGGTTAAGGVAGSGGSLASRCCQKDLDCGDLLYEPCVNGVCKSTVVGRCWTNSECPNGASCVGASVCGCGLRCDQGDTPGKCAPPSVDAGSAVLTDGSVADGGKDASGVGGADGGPVDCAASATCPSESCQIVCCSQGGECAPCCVRKACQAFDAAHCPLDACQLLPTCAGTSVCYPFFTAPPPSCGGLGYYGGHAACCSGVVLRCGLPLSAESCDLTVGGYNGFPMCVACGDGNCDTQYENRCSCPEDCHG
jgi:hypothetical protein